MSFCIVSMCVCASFPFGFEGGMWNLIVLVLGHCLCFCTFLFYIDNSNKTPSIMYNDALLFISGL